MSIIILFNIHGRSCLPSTSLKKVSRVRLQSYIRTQNRLKAVVPKGIRRLSPNHNGALAKLCHVKYRFIESRSYQSGL